MIARDMTLEEVERTFTAFDYAPQPQSRPIDPHASRTVRRGHERVSTLSVRQEEE